MATVEAVKQAALRYVGPAHINQLNFEDPELFAYINEFLSHTSHDLAGYGFRGARTNTTLSFASGVNNADLPADFLAVYMVFEDGTDTTLTRASDSEIAGYEGTSDQGTPCKWYLTGTEFYVYPTPDSAFTVKLVYYPEHSISDNTDTLPWNGLFDKALRWFLVRQIHYRSEQFGFSQMDQYRYRDAYNRGIARCLGRDDFQIGFANGNSGLTGNSPSSGPFYYNPPSYP